MGILLPIDLIGRCRETLVKCDKFDTHQKLQTVFVGMELAPFKSALPDADDLADRVDKTVEFLLEKGFRNGQPLFLLFLKALLIYIPKEDDLHTELYQCYLKVKDEIFLTEAKPSSSEYDQSTMVSSQPNSVDINFFIADLPGIISDLKTSIPDKQATAIERLTNVLYQIGLYQKQISELKFFHNELHNLETGLALIVNSIRNAVRQNESLRLYDIEDNWRMAVLPCMQAMRVFASEEMKFLREPRFKITPGGIGGSKWVIEGPQWVIDLVAFQIEFEHYFNGRNKKQDTKVISKVPGEMLDKCREHLLRIDRRLLEAINKLDEFSNQILQGVRNA